MIQLECFSYTTVSSKGNICQLMFTFIRDLTPDLNNILFNCYFCIASHPSVEGVLFWGFWDRRHWRGADASLVDGGNLTVSSFSLCRQQNSISSKCPIPARYTCSYKMFQKMAQYLTGASSACHKY